MKQSVLVKLGIGAAALWLATLLFASAVCAVSALPEWSGAVKTLQLYGKGPVATFHDYQAADTSLRLNMNWQAAKSWQLETSLEYQYFWSDPGGLFPRRAAGDNRHIDMEQSWQHGEHSASRLQVDRLNLQWRSAAVDMTIGRQPLGFGRILIYSPLDIIAPFSPDSIDTEVRSGVDALHATYNYGLDGQLGAIAVWGKDTRQSSFLATWSDNRAGVDLLMIGGQLRGRSLFGAGLAGSLGTLGLKGEFSLHQGKEVGEAGGDLYDSYALAAIEAWYRFDNGISLITQYLYNGPGAKEPSDYLQVLSSAPRQEGLSYLLGRNYLLAAPSYELHPLATLQGLLIYNLDDKSALVRPSLDLSLADNVSLQLFWTAHSGRQPKFTAPYLPAQPQSEFGLRGNNVGLFLNWFF